MSLDNIENRVMPRSGIFPRKLDNRQDDSQKQPVVPIRVLKDGVEVSEELKHKIELPKEGLLNREDAEQYLNRVGEEIREHPDDMKLYQEQYDKLLEHEPNFISFTERCESLNMSMILNKIDDWKSTFSDGNLTTTLESIVNGLRLPK